jgi:DNA-binding CsgD family transcriptional regulator
VPGGQDLLVIGFHRHVGHKHFEDNEIQWFERLTPHLGRVLKVLTAQLRSNHLQAVKGVTDQLSHLAVFALDDGARLLEANECATALLRTNDPLTLRHGKLTAVSNNQDVNFSALFRQALAGTTAHLTLANDSRERRLCVTLLPAPIAPLQTVTNRRLAVVVIACDTAARRVATAAQLMEFFRLTAAEARLVRALCHGEDVQSYAEEEDLKVTTVRSHLKAAMEKTETHNQRELVRVVMAIPAVRS